MNKQFAQSAGFSIIEVMIYVAVVTVAMVILSGFAVDVAKNAARSRVIKEVELNASLTLHRLSSEVRHAQSIASISATELTLLDANNDTLVLRYNSAEKKAERVLAGNVESITAPAVRVINLYFSPVGQGVEINLQVAQGPENVPAIYQYQTSLQTKVFPRQLLY